MEGHATDRRRKVHLLLLRTSPDLKKCLGEAATEHGRSLTQEIESRLEGLFLQERLQGGAHTATLLHRLRERLVVAEMKNSGSWWEDRHAWSAILLTVEDVLSKPPTDPLAYDDKPQESGGDAKATITVRCTTDLKQQLDDAAELAGRSLNREAEARLYRSVASDNLELSERTSAFLGLIGALLREFDAVRGSRWSETQSSRSAALQLVRSEFRKRRPPLPIRSSRG